MTCILEFSGTFLKHSSFAMVTLIKHMKINIHSEQIKYSILLQLSTRNHKKLTKCADGKHIRNVFNDNKISVSCIKYQNLPQVIGLTSLFIQRGHTTL